ncbi:RnfABCDGE type electron transport complex subunit B [Diaphorobacter sp. JS3050]|uniref:RnfABCDGE type electron transport complex subunit B n=1 Tax=unclassified Diaphorobacter TaxID=2649760 RepID=UPI00155426BD|nr:MULTISPECIES: RnfABCDGE type electron transport complex subunit B [unclassified Diaphorobacter]QJY33166.1 RnfABCDGE type electron transport complex subunit B [Diaphorobacter sp. JS3050]QYY27294.1 RnfABCDGE type electron transport complex subunit B [Diaphorobacter sp. MNS-0]
MTSPAAQQALVERIDAALPQTQCTRCGYPDCQSYALAIARGEAEINQCPPGGAQGVARLAAITGRPELPLSAAHGTEVPRAVAVIDENWCIGCTLCLKACPTDAILGINKRMHTVIAPHCTGCELCLPACPVDCIRMENASGQATGWAAWSAPQAEQARVRYQARQERLQREEAQAAATEPVPPAPDNAPDPKRAAIAAALARARAQRADRG